MTKSDEERDWRALPLTFPKEDRKQLVGAAVMLIALGVYKAVRLPLPAAIQSFLDTPVLPILEGPRLGLVLGIASALMGLGILALLAEDALKTRSPGYGEVSQ